MLDSLQPNPGSKKSRMRKGRGTGSKGRYCGRGVKGQGTRSQVKGAAFEGGQMPLNMRRVPKRGFSNHRFKSQVEIVNLAALAAFGEGAHGRHRRTRREAASYARATTP